jgi:hypothetical protein
MFKKKFTKKGFKKPVWFNKAVLMSYKGIEAGSILRCNPETGEPEWYKPEENDWKKNLPDIWD